MKLQLDPQWREILKRAWSIRFMAAATLFAGLEAAVPFLEDVLPVDRGTFAALAFVATAGAMASRVIAQRNLTE